MSAAVRPDLPTLPRRLGLILDGLRRVLAVHTAKDRGLAGLVLILWNRLARLQARVIAIAARHQAGTLRPPPQRRPGRPPTMPPAPDKLPRQRAWLLRRVQECAVYGEHLRRLLDDPEVAEMIQAAPQLRPLLRPLWRMLRTESPPQVLQSPPPPGPPPRQAERRSSQITPHAALPLPAPRYVQPGTVRAPARLSLKRA